MREKIFSLFSVIEEVESAKSLRKRRYDRTVALRVIVELKQWCCHQFVVPWHCKVRSFRQLHQEEFSVLLRLSDVRWDVGVLCRLKVWPPPVADRVFDNPFLRKIKIFH